MNFGQGYCQIAYKPRDIVKATKGIESLAAKRPRSGKL